MIVKYQVALVVDVEVDVEVEGDPETGLEGTVMPGDLDADNPIHSVMASAAVEKVIGPALRSESGLHNDVVAWLETAAAGIAEAHPGEVKIFLHHIAGHEQEIKPVRIA